jgi:hypothetical protein
VGRFLAHPLTPLILFSVALTGLLTVCLVSGESPSTPFKAVASFSWSMLLALWIIIDARRRSRVPCFDFGLFCYLFLPVVVPWYCFWSRGWRGVLTLAALAGLWLAPYLVASVVWLALYG